MWKCKALDSTQKDTNADVLNSKNWECYIENQQPLRASEHLNLEHGLQSMLYTLSGRIGKVVASHAAVARSIPLRCTDLYYARGAQGALPMRVGGATSQLDLPSLTPLSVAGCGWLQLGVPQWAASVHYCK